MTPGILLAQKMFCELFTEYARWISRPSRPIAHLGSPFLFFLPFDFFLPRHLHSDCFLIFFIISNDPLEIQPAQCLEPVLSQVPGFKCSFGMQLVGPGRGTVAFASRTHPLSVLTAAHVTWILFRSCKNQWTMEDFGRNGNAHL